jgi:Protein of unknown function (DUF416)
MYPDDFISEVALLPTMKQFLFGLSQTERILHFYETFEEEWEVDQPYKLMVDALEQGYQYVINPTQQGFDTLVTAMNEVKKGIPDLDEYRGGSEVTFGHNAALALYCSLKFVVQNKLSTLIEAVGMTIDIVDGVVLDRVNDEAFDTRPDIDQEIALQLDFMEYISNVAITADSVVALRRLSQQNLITA